MTPEAATPPPRDDPAPSPVARPRTGAGRIATPVSARWVIVGVAGLLVVMDLRTLIDRTIAVDPVLAAAPWIADPIALLFIVLGLRRAPVIGFTRRPRPLHLKVFLGLTVVAFVFYALAPHYDARADYLTVAGRYYSQVAGVRTEMPSSSYWSEVHARDRFAIATNLAVMLVMLSIVEARVGSPPCAGSDAARGRIPPC